MTKRGVKLALKLLGRRVRAVFNLALGRGLSQEIFDLLYTVKEDPWQYRTSVLERGKYTDLLTVLPQLPWHRALEVGCSEGLFTRMLADRVECLKAIDFSPKALARAQQKLVGLDHVQLEQLNIRDQEPGGTFDLIVASEVLYYMGDVHQIRALGRRMLSWLKPGGHLLLCHMRSQSDESQGIPVSRWTPVHPGAFTVHAIFDEFPELVSVSELQQPLYKISLYRLA